MIYLGKSGKSHLTASIKENVACKDCKKKYYKVSDESRKKMSIARLGKPSGKMGWKASEEIILKMSIAQQGKKHSDETKKKMSDSHKGENGYWYGKKLSEEHRINLSIGGKGKLPSRGFLGHKRTDVWKENHSKFGINRYANINERLKTKQQVKEAMHRPDVRKKHITALLHSKWMKVRTDKGQIELLEKWNRLGFNFEPNYQIHTDSDLFYVDGYDSIHNVVMEYDSKYHNRLGQKKKDFTRQQIIIEVLKPKAFWRYDSTNKTFTNVIGKGEE